MPRLAKLRPELQGAGRPDPREDRLRAELDEPRGDILPDAS